MSLTDNVNFFRSLTESEDGIQKAISSFPKEFGLKGFPGSRFKLNARDSFMSGSKTMLVVDIMGKAGKWLNFSEATPGEIRKEMTK